MRYKSNIYILYDCDIIVILIPKSSKMINWKGAGNRAVGTGVGGRSNFPPPPKMIILEKKTTAMMIVRHIFSK